MTFRLGPLEFGRPAPDPAPAPSPPPPSTEPEGEAGGRLPGPPKGPPPPPKRFTAILGESGAGKTVYMNQAAAAAVHAGGRLVYIDAKGDNGHMGDNVRSVRELLAYLGDNAGRRCWSVVLDAQGITRQQMAPVWEALRRMGSVVVALDEADRWIHSGIGNEIQPAELRHLIGWGRSRGVAILATARQPAEVHRDLRNSLTAAVSFSHSDQAEAEKVARLWFGNAALADTFRQLEPLHYLRVNRESGRITRGRVWPPGTPEGNRALAGG